MEHIRGPVTHASWAARLARPRKKRSAQNSEIPLLVRLKPGMFRKGELEAFSGPMSNYSVFFLLQNAHVHTNCSVYSLISGLITAQDFDTQLWQNNSLDFLPAYYVTNCSISDLVQQIRNQNLTADDVAAWLDHYYINPYNVADNGDSFVALLYVLLGLCVSCWMLMFVIWLLPKHKRKPLLPQLAMLVYLLVLTAIFVKINLVAKEQYYMDSLDMVRLLSLTAERPFAICLAILELLTNLAYLQLILKLSRHKWATINRWFVSFLTVASLVVYSLLISRIQKPATFVTANFDPSRSGHMSINLVFMAWFAGNLGYYTVCGRAVAPQKVSYVRNLLPLACLVWLTIALYVIISILMLSLWSEAWLINVWVSFLPTLLKMHILIISWEWLYLIRHMEQRLELGDVLGRRISIDDVEAFNNDKIVKSALFQSRFSSVLNFLCGSSSSQPGPLKDSASKGPTATSLERSGYSRTEARATSGEEIIEGELQDDASYQEVHMDDADIWEVSEDEIASRAGDSASIQRADLAGDSVPGQSANLAGASDSQSPSLADGVRNVAEMTSQERSLDPEAEEPPSFIPHPGYNVDDYWEEKGHN